MKTVTYFMLFSLAITADTMQPHARTARRCQSRVSHFLQIRTCIGPVKTTILTRTLGEDQSKTRVMLSFRRGRSRKQKHHSCSVTSATA